MRAPQFQHRRLDLLRSLIGVLSRSPPPVLQRFQPSLPVSPQPVVSGLPRDVVHLAQLASSCANRVPAPIQTAFFRPRHYSLSRACSSFYTPRQLEVSGMSPVQSVRNVPGLYQKLAQRGSAGYINRREAPLPFALFHPRKHLSCALRVRGLPGSTESPAPIRRCWYSQG